MRIPLVLLPGLLSNEVLWKHQIRHLENVAEIQVIAAVQNTPQKMVETILHNAPPKFALAGHSMGGWLCLEIMRVAPNRVSHLCLLNTTANPDSPEKRSRREAMIQRAEKGEFPQVVKELVEKLVFNSSVKKDVEKMFLEAGKDVLIHQEKSMLAREECQSILPTITCPTLVVHGMQDENFSFEESKELVDRIRGAKLATIEDSGHMSPMEMPQAVTALLRFWLTY